MNKKIDLMWTESNPHYKIWGTLVDFGLTVYATNSYEFIAGINPPECKFDAPCNRWRVDSQYRPLFHYRIDSKTLEKLKLIDLSPKQMVTLVFSSSNSILVLPKKYFRSSYYPDPYYRKDVIKKIK